MSEKDNKRAFMMAMALCTEFFGLSLAGIFGGQYLGGFADHPTLGAIAGFAIGCGIWIWRLVSTKRYLL